MKLCRFHLGDGVARVGVRARSGEKLVDLSAAGIARLHEVLDEKHPARSVERLKSRGLPRHELSTVTLLAPVDEQEVWAVGVTYLRSKAARMDESEFSASAYDRVYDAKRPELFFKSLPHKVVGTGDAVGIRRDARWSVPEPELVLVFNSRGALAGYAIGNDMSSRDIEGENLLYLPQAKIYDRSCAIGPWVEVGATEDAARRWTISISIRRGGREVFAGRTRVSRTKRSFEELRRYLLRSQTFPHGAMLFTGTGIVPADDFTLHAADVVTITISGIGTLNNPVVVV